jgi:4-hydroxythreonine-4-phosphate dehydrogenase
LTGHFKEKIIYYLACHEVLNVSDLPFIGITMGDPAGIGPEIIVEALNDPGIYMVCRPVVLGDRDILSSTISNASGEVSLNVISEPSEAKGTQGKIDLIAVSRLRGGSILPGKPSIEGSKAMVEYIFTAVKMSRERRLGAMVTCPISKIEMHRAGYPYEGHTELISHLTGTQDSVMMLAGERMRVALVTIHCPIKEVPAILNEDRVYKTITITARALREDFGYEHPRLAVAALNPHAGESGLFGLEEERIIEPAVARARKKDFLLEGPLPADTLFYKAASGEFDAVVAMYHDQGLIPLKLLHFSDAVNVTLGLPIVRTSVDHGTAYDIAGTGRADATSLKAAIKMAAQIIKNRNIK